MTSHCCAQRTEITWQDGGVLGCSWHVSGSLQPVHMRPGCADKKHSCTDKLDLARTQLGVAQTTGETELANPTFQRPPSWYKLFPCPPNIRPAVTGQHAAQLSGGLAVRLSSTLQWMLRCCGNRWDSRPNLLHHRAKRLVILCQSFGLLRLHEQPLGHHCDQLCNISTRPQEEATSTMPLGFLEEVETWDEVVRVRKTISPQARVQARCHTVSSPSSKSGHFVHPSCSGAPEAR